MRNKDFLRQKLMIFTTSIDPLCKKYLKEVLQTKEMIYVRNLDLYKEKKNI